jgi:hypothetical protein
MAVEHETLDAVGGALQLIERAGGQRRRQGGPLPAIVVVDLAHRRAEPVVQLALERGQLLALSLQIAVGGEVEVDEEEGDEGGRADQEG